MSQSNQPQAIEKRPKSLRLVLSNKSAAKIMPEVREGWVEDLMECPDPERLTDKSGSTAIQMVFGILWVLAWKVERLERLKAQQSGIRDGFGSPKLAEIPRKGVTSETSVREFRSVGAA